MAKAFSPADLLDGVFLLGVLRGDSSTTFFSSTAFLDSLEEGVFPFSKSCDVCFCCNLVDWRRTSHDSSGVAATSVCRDLVAGVLVVGVALEGARVFAEGVILLFTGVFVWATLALDRAALLVSLAGVTKACLVSFSFEKRTRPFSSPLFAADRVVRGGASGSGVLLSASTGFSAAATLVLPWSLSNLLDVFCLFGGGQACHKGQIHHQQLNPTSLH